MSLTKYDIEQLCLFDDEMFRLCLKNCPEGIEYIIRTILDMPNLRVIKHSVQKRISNPRYRSVRLDVYAEDAEHNKYNIEIQKGKANELPQRSRYYSALIDARTTLEPNDKFTALPRSYVIFICSDDIMRSEEALQWYTRTCRGTGKELGDGTNIVIVNGSYQGKDKIGQLISDLHETDTSNIHNEILSRQVSEVKTNEIRKRMNKNGGVNMVVTHFDRLMMKEREEGKSEGKAEGKAEGETQAALDTARRMLTKGKLSVEEIAEYSDLPLEKVKELADSMTA